MPNPPTLEARFEARKRPRSAVVMRQRWAHLLFLHWEVPVDLIQATLPRGLSVDTFDDKAYLGIVPFFMEGVRPRPFPAVPGLSNFLELNLRTYVYDHLGRPGVWFYSLDCNQWLAVKIARLGFHLPYEHARMSAKIERSEIAYASQRWGDASVQAFRYPAETSDQANVTEPGSLEFFLLERYRLFSARSDGRLYSGLVHHKPYRCEATIATGYSTRLFPLNGFDEPSTAPISSLLAQRVEIDVHPLERVPPESP